MRALIIEDDLLVADGLKQGLQQFGYTVDWVGNAENAITLSRDESFDIMLVDIGLPGRDGLHFIRTIRNRGDKVPIMAITARTSMEDTVLGLDAGADDYLYKPFRLPEVAARMRALIRRSNDIADARIRHGSLVLDSGTRSATLDGKEIELTRSEWAILELLALSSPSVVSKEKLIQNLTGWDKDITPNAIQVHISRLRTKLAPGNITIRTVRGIGYRIDATCDEKARSDRFGRHQATAVALPVVAADRGLHSGFRHRLPFGQANQRVGL